MGIEETVRIYRITDGRIDRDGGTPTGTGGALLCYYPLGRFLQEIGRLGISRQAVEELTGDRTHFRSSVDVFERYSLGLVNVIDVRDVERERDRILFVVMSGMFALVSLEDENQSVRQLFEETVERQKNSTSLEKFIFGLLERLLSGGNTMLETVEQRVMELERRLTQGEADRELNRTIYSYRRQLSSARNYYEQLVDIGEELAENENGLLEEGSLHLFGRFALKAGRLSSGTQLLTESLVHLREALEATLNYNLSSIMKVFTVVTTIFLPLTLIVGWYGMNFKHMPELGWAFGYPAVAILCGIVAAASLLYFRKKRFM